jgi:hypothetical protein
VRALHFLEIFQAILLLKSATRFSSSYRLHGHRRPINQRRNLSNFVCQVVSF